MKNRCFYGCWKYSNGVKGVHIVITQIIVEWVAHIYTIKRHMSNTGILFCSFCYKVAPIRLITGSERLQTCTLRKATVWTDEIERKCKQDVFRSYPMCRIRICYPCLVLIPTLYASLETRSGSWEHMFCCDTVVFLFIIYEDKMLKWNFFEEMSFRICGKSAPALCRWGRSDKYWPRYMQTRDANPGVKNSVREERKNSFFCTFFPSAKRSFI